MNAETAKEYIYRLANCEPHRRLGSRGNKEAVEYILSQLEGLDYEMDTKEFDCLDHVVRKVKLTSGGKEFEVFASSYSLPVDVEAELVHVSNMEELQGCECEGKVLLMTDELTKEQLMPKNFVFYNPEHHQKLYSVVEEKAPAAIITATGKDLQMVGNLYPFNVFEDGDHTIPTVTCKDVVGVELAGLVGEIVKLIIDAERIPSKGRNIILKKNLDAEKKVMLCAHLDTKADTPGASDNASGTTVLMLFAQMLNDYNGEMGLEIILFNGEDNYSVAGEMDYLDRYGEAIPKIALAVNIDDVGVNDSTSNFSFYGVEDDVQKFIKETFSGFASIAEGEQWFAGDHMIFAQQQVPTMAFTSSKCWDLMATVTHTPDDVPENIKLELLVELASGLKELFLKLQKEL